MNRRQFFGRVLGPIAAAVAVPELARTIFLPPRGGWPSALGDFDTANMRYLAHEGQYIQRYTYQTHALGFVITEEAIEDTVYRRSGIMTAAQFRKQLTADLNKAFSEAYSMPEQVEERLARML